jgi:hypothetical protein
MDNRDPLCRGINRKIFIVIEITLIIIGIARVFSITSTIIIATAAIGELLPIWARPFDAAISKTITFYITIVASILPFLKTSTILTIRPIIKPTAITNSLIRTRACHEPVPRRISLR